MSTRAPTFGSKNRYFKYLTICQTDSVSCFHLHPHEKCEQPSNALTHSSETDNATKTLLRSSPPQNLETCKMIKQGVEGGEEAGSRGVRQKGGGGGAEIS